MAFATTQFEVNRTAVINSINSKTSFTLIYVKIKRSKWQEEEQHNKCLNSLELTFNALGSNIEYYRVFEDEFILIIVNPLETQDIIRELKLNSNIHVQRLHVENRNLPALHYLRQVSNQIETNNEIQRNILKYGLNIEEFSTVFQPILHKNKQISFEALARWTSMDLGVITPTVFIPILEREGLLIILTKKIIDEAVNLLKRYKEIVYITINLTASLVKDITWLFKHLEGLDFQDNRRIAFELTEDSLAGVEVRENLRRIRNRGHLLFIDDFGSGYSNFQYLATFEFDGVKLDRVFMGEQTNKKVIILLSNLIKALDLKFIIEGVERYEQISIILETKYDAIQGYYISHPLNENDLDKFIADMRFDCLT